MLALVERDQHQLHAALLVLPKQLRVAKVVADQQAAFDPPRRKGDELGTRAVVFQVATVVTRPGAEELVVSGLDTSLVVDDVEGIVRLVLPSQRVIAPENDVDTQLRCQLPHLRHALAHQIPIGFLHRFQFGPKIAGQTGLGKMNEMGAPSFSAPHLAFDMREVGSRLLFD